MNWLVKVFFVGTGSGKTSLSRFHSSILISTHNTNLLIDTGDGISRALLKHKIDYNSIERIFITHLHADHYSGLPSLLTQMKMSKRQSDLFIYSDQSVIKMLKEYVTNSYLFPERMGFNLSYIPVEQDEHINLDKNFKLLARQNSHLNSSDTTGNLIQSSSSSLLVSVENFNIHYTSDIGNIKDLLLFNDSGTDLLICESSHIQLDKIQSYFISKVKSNHTIFSHIDEEDLDSISEVIARLPKKINKKMMIARDGLEIRL